MSVAARRCSRCDVNYPSEDTYESCLICEGETWKAGDEVWDTNWPDKVQRGHKRIAFLKSNEIPNVESTIFRYKDLLWIAEEVLENEGYDCVSLGIVKINDCFYELSGRRDGEVPSWWITLIEDEWPSDTPVLSLGQYAHLESKRGIRPI
jgi:hypothetical protein